MGFRPSHADEALEYSSDMATALDWLCKYNKDMMMMMHRNLIVLFI